MTLLGIGMSIGCLVALRLAWEWARHRPESSMVGEMASVRINVGTGSVGSDRCIIRSITREPSMDGIVRLKIEVDAVHRHF